MPYFEVGGFGPIDPSINRGNALFKRQRGIVAFPLGFAVPFRDRSRPGRIAGARRYSGPASAGRPKPTTSFLQVAGAGGIPRMGF
jgi:hypothetical protein